MGTRCPRARGRIVREALAPVQAGSAAEGKAQRWGRKGASPRKSGAGRAPLSKTLVNLLSNYRGAAGVAASLPRQKLEWGGEGGAGPPARWCKLRPQEGASLHGALQSRGWAATARRLGARVEDVFLPNALFSGSSATASWLHPSRSTVPPLQPQFPQPRPRVHGGRRGGRGVGIRARSGGRPGSGIPHRKASQSLPRAV